MYRQHLGMGSYTLKNVEVSPSKGVSGGPVITPLNLVRSDWSITSTLIAHCWACAKMYPVAGVKKDYKKLHVYV